MRVQHYLISVSPYALTFLRFWLGGAMIWYSFPVLFQGGLTDFSHYLNSMGVPMPFFLGFAAKCFEFFGGLMVLTGFYSRIGGLMIAIVMFVAVGVAHDFKVFTEAGISFNLFIISVVIFFGGSGNFSLKSWPKTDNAKNLH